MTRAAALLALAGALSPSVAFAWESDPQELWFGDVYSLFGAVAFDTGYFPDPNGIVALRIYVTPSGGVITELEAESNLSWPETFLHNVSGVPGSGWFGIDTAVDVGAEVKIDIIGLYQSTVPLWTNSFDIKSGKAYDPLRLGGAPAEISVRDPNLIQPWRYDISVITGLLGFILEVHTYPEIAVATQPLGIRTSTMGVEVMQTGDAEQVRINVPQGTSVTSLPMVSTYEARLTTEFNFVIEPTLSLDAGLFGTYQIVNFPIDLPLSQTDEVRAFEPAIYEHPLPALDTIAVANDLGEVLVGQIDNIYVPFPNIGEMVLQGVARIEGPPEFSLFPEALYALPGDEDGLVVTFAPTAVGELEALLVIESNDPLVPELRIPLLGTGWEPEAPVVDPVDEEPPLQSFNPELAKGCGCDSGGQAPVGLGALGLLALLRRRRRQATRA